MNDNAELQRLEVRKEMAEQRIREEEAVQTFMCPFLVISLSVLSGCSGGPKMWETRLVTGT